MECISALHKLFISTPITTKYILVYIIVANIEDNCGQAEMKQRTFKHLNYVPIQNYMYTYILYAVSRVCLCRICV